MRRAWILVWVAFLSSCAEISLREAMGRVQTRHLQLQSRLEAGSNFGSRDAAVELEQALRDPAISLRSQFSGNTEYENLLQEAIASTQRIRQVAQKFDKEKLAALRGELSSRCDACHKAFRHP